MTSDAEPMRVGGNDVKVGGGWGGGKGQCKDRGEIE